MFTSGLQVIGSPLQKNLAFTAYQTFLTTDVSIVIIKHSEKRSIKLYEMCMLRLKNQVIDFVHNKAIII
uniref:Uncharacterized protein n=1 Tax=Romanomermis culicivorax TaxID=13658 RepID=A0A915JN54_ROMCU